MSIAGLAPTLQENMAEAKAVKQESANGPGT